MGLAPFQHQDQVIFFIFLFFYFALQSIKFLQSIMVIEEKTKPKKRL